MNVWEEEEEEVFLSILCEVSFGRFLALRASAYHVRGNLGVMRCSLFTQRLGMSLTGYQSAVDCDAVKKINTGTRVPTE